MIRRRLTQARRFLPLRHTRLEPRSMVDLGALVDVPDGYVATNPAIVRHSDGFLVCVRCVNYTSDDRMRVTFHSGDDFHSVNRVVRLNADLTVDRHLDSLGAALDGLEDVRMFTNAGKLMGIASEPGPGARSTMALLHVNDDLTGCSIQPLPSPRDSPREKNWSPFIDRGALRFVYSFEPLVLLDLPAGGIPTPAGVLPVALEFVVAGSTPGLASSGGQLFVVHRRKVLLPSLRRAYVSRMYELDPVGRLEPRGPWFTVGAPTIQFVSGLELDGDRLLLAYGERDRAARLACFDRAAFPGGQLLYSAAPIAY